MGRVIAIAVLAVLIVLGIAAAAGRFFFPSDLGARAEPLRARLMRLVGASDVVSPERAADVARFDARFGDNRTMTVTHVAFGGLFLAAASLQFSVRLRTRRPAVHRWLGRILVIAALATAISGLFFGLLVPFDGVAEMLATLIFGGLFAGATLRAWIAIRKGDVARHREWMIRAFAVAVGISLIRVIGAVIDLVSKGTIGSEAVLVTSLWAGWVIAAAAAELWIRQTRTA